MAATTRGLVLLASSGIGTIQGATSTGILQAELVETCEESSQSHRIGLRSELIKLRNARLFQKHYVRRCKGAYRRDIPCAVGFDERQVRLASLRRRDIEIGRLPIA